MRSFNDFLKDRRIFDMYDSSMRRMILTWRTYEIVYRVVKAMHPTLIAIFASLDFSGITGRGRMSWRTCITDTKPPLL
jgi:hypothetical protein